MKNIIYTILLSVTLIACSSVKKIDALKPETDPAKPLVYAPVSSFIGIPITIPLKDINQQVNKLVTGLIYEDANLSDDNIMLKVWKEAPIQLTDENGRLKTLLPLKVWAKVQYGKTILGVPMYDTREINLNGVVNLASDIALSGWKIKTNTNFKSIDWKERPSITIAGKNIPIHYIVDPALKYFKKDIEKAIDDAITQAVDFKPEVLKGLTIINEPIKVDANFNTWFQITPQELYASQASLNKNELLIQLGLKSTMETFIGAKPSTPFSAEKIALKTVTKLPEKIQVNLAALSTYKDASLLITNNFKGQKFGDDKRSITVQNVNLWHKAGKIILALDVTGTITGTIYLNGIPKYNATTKEVYFDELDYVLDTKNKLIKTANWLAEGLILKKIKENCSYSIATNIKDAEKMIQPYLSNYSPIKGIFINGTLSNLDLKSIQLTDNSFVAFISMDGALKININGLE